ncbi:MAG: hypothetical protein ABIG61_08625 [Planctomycetota bacterium]
MSANSEGLLIEPAKAQQGPGWVEAYYNKTKFRAEYKNKNSLLVPHNDIIKGCLQKFVS